MSAGAPQPAIDALRRDKHVIVIEEEAWFQNLHRTIHHAATRKNFEVYLYDPLMQIFGTYAKTCSHEDYEVAVIPQGCFELRTDSSTRVTRTLSDALFAIHSKPTGDPGKPQYGKSRLGGWVEGKPWVQLPKKAKKKGAANAIKKVDAGKDNVEGQDNGSEDIAEEVSVDRECSAEEGTNTGEKDTSADEQGTNAEEDDAALDEEDPASDEDTASDVDTASDEDTSSDDEDVASDEEDITSDEEGTDADEEDRDEQEFDTGEVPAMSVDGPSVEDASALVLDPKEVTQRPVKDLHQLCKQAYFAFNHFDDDEILSFITYGMTFSCFKFIRPANWNSIRGDKNGIVEAPIPIYSNERMVFNHWINPYLNKALRLMTASLDLTYQPSWFDPPTHDIPEPNLSIAQDAINLYKTKIKGTVLGSSPDRRPTKPVKGDSPYVDLTKEATTPVIQLRPKLRSGIGGAEPAPEQHDRTDPTSSDTEGSPLAPHLQPQSAQSGRASQENDAPATSGIPGTAGSSTEGTRNLADNARTPALALTSGVNLNDKLLAPKNRGERIPKVSCGKARQKNIDFRTNANGPALPALLSPPINDAPTDSRTGMRSSAKLRKRKDRPSSPLRFDSPDPDPAGNGVPTLAGPSKKPRLTSQTDEKPVDNGTGGPSSISRMEAEVSAGATSAMDDAAAERVYDPLTAPERTRRRNTRVYQSRAAAERRARSKTKPAAGTAETAAAVAEPAAPGRSGTQTRSIAGSSRARVRDSPPPQRKDTTKSKRSRK
ncbi:hypothetical protein EWM64_g7246 [Hericium alpestre]|uniref:Uncharacterized protein n=1 Tax=Hericium alpestre TaxID=135208 RepID=A0A4Y9ZTF0_9AGAM|nr:hypothetical protein EWM64_g7246 [Hericium alpestre]